MPSAVEDAVKEYKSEMDVITGFLEECTIRGPGEALSADLFKSYTDWADKNNEYKMSRTAFGTELGLRYEKGQDSKGRIVYKGIRLLEEHKPYNINFGGM